MTIAAGIVLSRMKIKFTKSRMFHPSAHALVQFFHKDYVQKNQIEHPNNWINNSKSRPYNSHFRMNSKKAKDGILDFPM